MKHEELTLIELLENVGAGLLTPDFRQDRIIIGYHNHDSIQVSLDWLIGKASLYYDCTCMEIVAEGGAGKDPVMDIRIGTSNPKYGKVYSVDMCGDWTNPQLETLSRQFEAFRDLQMFFWVQNNKLDHYLEHLFIMQQFCQIYYIDDRLTLREIVLAPELIEPSDNERSEWSPTTQRYVEALEDAWDSSHSPTEPSEGEKE